MRKSAFLVALAAMALSVMPLLSVSAAGPTPPNPGPMLAPCAPGQMPTQASPCMLPPCAAGQSPTPNNPCAVVGEQPGGPVVPGGGPGGPGTGGSGSGGAGGGKGGGGSGGGNGGNGNQQQGPNPNQSADANGIPYMSSLQQTFSSKYPPDATQTFSTQGGTNGKVGIFFVSNIRGAVLPSIEVRKSTQDGSTFNAHQCTSIDDPSCDPSKGWNGIKVVSGIGNCYNDPAAIISCVESFSIIGADGKEHVAKPESKFPANATEFAGSPGVYPAGKAPWLWTVADDPAGPNSEYLLTGAINSSSENKSVPGTKKLPGRGGVVDGKWLPLVQTFSFEVVPVYKEDAPGLKANLAQEVVDNNGLHRVVSVPVLGCYAADDGICLNRRPFADGVKVKLAMHLSKRISGWIVGRLDRPQVSTQPINDNVDRINVQAGISKDVFAGNWLDASSKVFSALKAPSACPDNNKFGAMVAGQQQEMGMDPGENCAINFYQQIGPLLGDKAYAITPSWTMTTAQRTSNTSKCITDFDGLAGVGATNASAYDPGAPEYNEAKGSLTYHVAAPSLGPDGSSIAARYALSMPVSVFECLYNVKSVPPQATIAVTSLNGSTVTQSVILNQASGWVNFAADNFDFSDTSLLTITLGKSAPASSTAATSSTSKATTPSKPATKTTITCMKGKVKKTVTGVNPTCPAGYQQK